MNERDEVPARVRVACSVLGHFTAKTATHGMVGQVGDFHEVPGQALSDDEAGLQATACNMLSSYLAGRMPLSAFERHAQDMVGKALDAGMPQGGVVMACFACDGGNRAGSCRLCRSSGRVIVYPALPGGAV